MRTVVLLLVLASCAAADDDAFWSETVPDDGAELGLAAAAGRVAIGLGATAFAELVKLVPVGRSEAGAPRRVVLRMSPGELPALRRGDRLIPVAELEITTRCDVGQTAPGCNYNPHVRAQLVLTGNRDDTSGSGNSHVIATKTQDCTHADHHCTFVFTAADTAFELGGQPCVAADRCYVNLVVWAWHPDARPGGADDVLVGQNEGNFLDTGIVKGDSARLAAVRERGITADDRAMRETSGGGSLDMPLDARGVVVYSHRLKDGDLVAGEQFYVEAKSVVAVSSRARYSTELIVTKDPRATSNDGGINDLVPRAINEGNGRNCTAGTSPCTARKVAVLRVTGEIHDPVYVNVIAYSEVPGPGSARVTVRRGEGFVRSVRYAARLAGP